MGNRWKPVGTVYKKDSSDAAAAIFWIVVGIFVLAVIF